MIDKLKKKEYTIKANKYLDHYRYKITKKNVKSPKSYNKYIIEIFLFIILDLIFLPIRTSENTRKASTLNKITYFVLGGERLPILSQTGNPQSYQQGNQQESRQENRPFKVLINDTEVKITNGFYNFREGINKVELFFDRQVYCKNMFRNLDRIISIDLSDFSSAMEGDMSYMFSGCKNLVSIDFGDFFDTSFVENMEYMFSECTKLKSLNLERFNTRLVENMNNMFYKAESLLYLDLANFDTSSVSSMNKMFFGCDSLVYINLYSFIEKQNLQYSDIFNYQIDKLIYCINPTLANKIYTLLNNANQKNDCGNICFNRISKIIPKKKICIDKCENDDIYQKEDNRICYKDPSSSDSNDDSKSTEESSESSEESSESSEESSENSEESSESSEESSENSEESSESSEESSESSEESSESSEESSESQKESSESSEESSESQKESNESPEVTEKKEDSDSTLVTNNEEKFDPNSFFKESKQKDEEELSNKDEVIKSLKENILSGNMNSMITNLINGTKEDLIAEYKDITYQLTTTANQKEGSYNNISTIDLGECEGILKGIYGIDSNLSLIIMKIDYKMEGLLIPVIGYEVYNPLNNSLLNLSYCKNTSIKLNIPVSINEEEVEKYDPNSDYYNDECYAYTTENGADIILNDRKDEYTENNLSLCENNCQFNGYNSTTKKAICECVTKVEINYISDILSEENILSNNLNSTESSKTNIGTMKCVSLLFSKNGLIKNIGSYILFFTLGLFGIGIFIFYKCGYELIDQNVKEIVKSKKRMAKNKDKYKVDDNKNILKKTKTKKNKSKNNVSNPVNKKSKYKKNMSSMAVDQPLNSGSKPDFKHSKSILNNNTEKDLTIYKKKDKNKKEKIDKKMSLMTFKESELNLLKYKDAKIYDKRTFGGYYGCLNKIKIWILFAFYPMDDYNIKIIKICLFFLCFVIFFSVNTFFFNDETFHQIYLDGGKYNFSYFLPQIIYSFVISHLISVILKYFCLSERNLLEIKNEENLEEISDKADKVKRCLIIKYIIFFIISFVFLMVFWYYLSSFCAVYKNTQIYLLINTFISFVISSLFPLVFNFIPCIFRIQSLKNKNSEFLYNISKFIQIL